MPTDPDPLPWWRHPAARWAAYAACWVVCLACAGARLVHARSEYNDPKDVAPESARPGGNHGHTHIDFGGQWVMARMVARGHAADLYNRTTLRAVVREGYPPDREPPAARDHSFPSADAPSGTDGHPVKHDSDALLGWFMGKDSPRWPEAGAAVALPFAADALAPNPLAAAALAAEADARLTPDLLADLAAKPVGGPLYPPVHGFLYAPLGWLDPPTAYAVFQWFAVGLTLVAGAGASVLSRGRVWAPVAATGFFIYPGYRAGLDLGQNPAVTLTIVVWGWALAARGRPLAGGVVWGLLAFKPVWAAAFLLVPVLQGRWRFVLATGLTGAALGAATLYFVGFHGWIDWLIVGDMARATYDVNQNWVTLSRDLHGIPRRILLDFTTPEDDRHDPRAAALGWALWAVAVGTTAVVYLVTRLGRGGRGRPTGVGAGFLFLGAFLGCYRFMYYDVVLSAIGVLVLWGRPARLWKLAAGHLRRLPFGPRWLGYVTVPPVLLVLLLVLCENVVHKYQLQATARLAGVSWLPDGASARHTPQVAAEVGYYHPWDTALVAALWAWCGWRLVWGPGVQSSKRKVQK